MQITMMMAARPGPAHPHWDQNHSSASELSVSSKLSPERLCSTPQEGQGSKAEAVSRSVRGHVWSSPVGEGAPWGKRGMPHTLCGRLGPFTPSPPQHMSVNLTLNSKLAPPPVDLRLKEEVPDDIHVQPLSAVHPSHVS